MAHTISTAKRIRQNRKRRARNRTVASRVRTHEKSVLTAVGKKDAEGAKKALQTACQTIDKAAKQGVLHSNAAARKKSRLALRVNAILK